MIASTKHPSLHFIMFAFLTRNFLELVIVKDRIVVSMEPSCKFTIILLESVTCFDLYFYLYSLEEFHSEIHGIDIDIIHIIWD